MDAIARLLRRLRAMSRRRELEREMDEEIRFHLEMESRDPARRAERLDPITTLRAD